MPQSQLDRQSHAEEHLLPVFDLGTAPYEPLQRLQGRLRQAVAEGTVPGVLLLLEHEPVITLGSRATEQDLRDVAGCTTEGSYVLGAGDIRAGRPLRVPVVRSERGGQATLHAPGQLVSYPVVRIPGHNLGAYVHGLEQTLMVLLAGFGIVAARRKRHPGLYVNGEKIASVGLRCQRWVASHGTSLNVDIDTSLFQAIVSCGEADLRQTSMKALIGEDLSMAEVKTAYWGAFVEVFGWALLPTRSLSYTHLEGALGL
ncbi:MAG TPA: lipoyl(octanoyl) transferase LipB [Thermoleophilia bacterium]